MGEKGTGTRCLQVRKERGLVEKQVFGAETARRLLRTLVLILCNGASIWGGKIASQD